MSTPGELPDLRDAWIRSSERSGDRLRLELENIRRAGIVHAGSVVFTGVTDVEVTSERPMDRVPASPRPTGMVTDANTASGITVLATQSQSGPGELDRYRYTIRHSGLETHLRSSLARTIRRMAGLYPRSGDLHD